MTKIAQIIDSATSDEASIPTLLRLVKVVAARLKATDLAAWVDHELGGYDGRVSLPPYRVTLTDIEGTFNISEEVRPSRGAAGSPVEKGGETTHGDRLNSRSLDDSLASLNRAAALHSRALEQLFLEGIERRQSILSILASQKELIPLVDKLPFRHRCTLSIAEVQRRSLAGQDYFVPWPPPVTKVINDLFNQLQIQPHPGLQLVEARQVVRSQYYAQIAEQVRTRVLSLALDLEQLDPNAGEVGADVVKPATAIHLTLNHIYGNGNAVSVGSSESVQSIDSNESLLVKPGELPPEVND